MKLKAHTAVLILAILTANLSCFAQQLEEAVLQNLEDLEREAILKSDTTMLLKLMSPDLLVHNPENSIVGLKQVLARVKEGKINYASFERKIEKIAIKENVGIVMGEETIKPRGVTMHQGKTLTRRFTNIWLKENNVWKLTARQSTIISIK